MKEGTRCQVQGAWEKQDWSASFKDWAKKKWSREALFEHAGSV